MSFLSFWYLLTEMFLDECDRLRQMLLGEYDRSCFWFFFTRMLTSEDRPKDKLSIITFSGGLEVDLQNQEQNRGRSAFLALPKL